MDNRREDYIPDDRAEFDSLQMPSRLLHTGAEFDPFTGAVSVPIYQVSTFAQKSLNEPGKWDYARSGNPTRDALENCMSYLEGAARSCAFSSGMAAITASLMLMNAGDHCIVTRDCYGGTHRLIGQVLNRFGLEFTLADTGDLSAVEAVWRPNTRAVFAETLSNPFLYVSDIAGLADLSHRRDAILLVDNTMLGPTLQRPLEQGADLVLHSATKYLAGHSDVIAGIASTRSEDLGKRLYFLQNSMGAGLSPLDCWLTMRGIKTLEVRMRRQEETAGRLAQWLSARSEVEKVFYPGLPDHPGHRLAAAQASGYGALLTFRLREGYDGVRLAEKVKLPALGVSLGSVESIISIPARQSHAAVPEEQRKARGIDDRLVRFAVGLEDVDDLKSDLERALSACRK